MNIIYISPIGAESPGLFQTFKETFAQHGHTETINPNEATCCFFDSHSGYLPYDWNILDVVIERRIPVVYFDAFDYHCDSSKYWFGFGDGREVLNHISNEWAKFYFLIRNTHIQLIYFMRKMQTNADYGINVYPLELVQFPDHDFPLTTMEELSSRPYDACFIGAESPRRKAFIESLQKDGRLKLDIQFTTERIPHEEWLNRHRRAKFFISADGGGLSDERAYQLMPLSTMLRQKNNQKLANPWTSLFDCVQVGEEDGVINSDDIEMIVNLCKDQDYLYQIYLQGNHTLKKYFNPTYRANYILNILKDNGIQ